MLFQLESSIVSVRVFCCFSLGLLLFQSESSVCLPPTPDGKVGIRIARNLGFSDLHSTSFNPRTILFSLFFTSFTSMDLNPICHPSPAKNMKCSFLDYIQLLMIGLAGRWTQTPSATPLQPKKWNAHFWNTFNFCSSAGLVDGLEPHMPSLSSQKYEMLIFGLRSTPDD